ncbi:MAG: ClbS/DfsB family four-helix bundle protein [Chloroflexota bacterium]
MSTVEPKTKAELRAGIDTTWLILNDALDQLTAEQMITLSDEEGWTVTDHLVHLAAWERSAAAILDGRPRYEGLGVDEALYRADDVEAIHEAIVHRRRDISPEEARADLRAAHAELLALIDPLTDEALLWPVGRFLPDGPDHTDERPVITVLYGNTMYHFNEHLSWILAIAGES